VVGSVVVVGEVGWGTCVVELDGVVTVGGGLVVAGTVEFEPPTIGAGSGVLGSVELKSGADVRAPPEVERPKASPAALPTKIATTMTVPTRSPFFECVTGGGASAGHSVLGSSGLSYPVGWTGSGRDNVGSTCCP